MICPKMLYHLLLMSFNPTKCEMIRISNKKNPIVGDYYIQNYRIKAVTCTKYLGVTIDEHLSFNEHISRICHKANSMNAFLQRNIKSCPPRVKEICYKIMVRPIIEYACTVWSPHTKKNIQSLEAVQRRAARFVQNDYGFTSSVTAMLQDLGWPTLEERRWSIKATMLFKILHNMVCIPADQYLSIVTDHTRRHQPRLKQYPFFHVDAFIYSFFPSTVVIWNTLPDNVINVRTIDEFKAKLTYDFLI